MTVYSIIKKSQLQAAHRMDAEYFQPEYLKVDKIISHREYKTIKEIAGKVFSGPFGSTLKSESYQKKGVPFIRIGSIDDIFVNKENLVYISTEEHKRIYSTHLKHGDIVFSKIGTIGKLSVISKDLREVNISENNIGIRLETLSPAYRVYLLFFLLTKYGQSQIIRKGSGNIQQKLNVADIESIKIPVLPDESTHKILKNYQELVNYRKESLFFYSQAENLLLGELGLKDFGVEEDLSYIVNLSDIKFAHRADAEYFQPIYKNLETKIKHYEFRKLGELVSMEKGFEPGADAYQEKGIAFIRVSNISKRLIIDRDQKYLKEDTYKKLKNNFGAQVGEILLTKDATPGIAYVLKEPLQGIIASGILRLKPKEEIEPEYLALCINSLIGQQQVKRDSGGSIIAHWKPEQIKNLLIPVLPAETQQKIADLVDQSHEAQKKAKELLEEAKKKVEEIIEKGNS